MQSLLKSKTPSNNKGAERPPSNFNRKQMKTLYLDMDGVVADFDAYATAVAGAGNPVDNRWPAEAWAKIVQNPRIYRDLPKTLDADRIVSYCREWCASKNFDLVFLTAVPKDNDMPWAFYDKVVWVQRFFPGLPVHFGPFSHDKQVHCQPGDILIDDRLSNIEEWSAAGGIAIRHTGDTTATLARLKELY
jgi:hypothetical protein